MITNDERDNLLKVITDWDYKESKILKFGVVYDVQKDNDKEIDKGQSMYLKIFDEEIKPGYDIDKIIIPIYKNPDSYEVLQNTMDEIGLMSIMPSDILDKCIMLAKTGGRDKSLKVIEQNEKTTLIN